MNQAEASAGSPSSEVIQVDIVSDVVCPWCIIGYKQFEKALTLLEEPVEVRLRWQPFELNPQMPAEGQNLREHLVQKAGITPAQSEAARARLTTLGDSLGFTFNFDDSMRIANTFRAHQLLHWAYQHKLQTQLKLALFAAYFTQRRDINTIEELVSIAETAGLPGEEARAVLEDGRYAQAVRAEERWWLEREITGVPAFIFNQRYSVMGAQDADTFVKVLHKTRELAKEA